MMTIQKYNTVKNQIDWSKNPKLKALKSDIEEIMEFYDDDKDIKETVDLFIKKVDAEYKKQTSSGKAEKPKQTQTKKDAFVEYISKQEKKFEKEVKRRNFIEEKIKQKYGFTIAWDILNSYKQDVKNDIKKFNEEYSKKVSKPQKNKKNATQQKKQLDKIEFVDHYKPEYLLLRRFYNLINSKQPINFRKLQLTFMAFEKAALERKVRKTSKVADLFTKVNTKLTKMYNAAKPTQADIKVKIKDKTFYAELEKYVKGYKTDPIVNLLKRYVALQGIKPEKAKAERLLKTITNKLKQPETAKHHYFDKLKKAKTSLENYVKQPTERIKAEAQGLNKPKKKTTAQIIAGLQPVSKQGKIEFVKFPMNNTPLAKFLGNLEVKPKGSIVITNDAPQGAGKTRFLFQQANLFAESGNKTLFISLEEHKESSLYQKKIKMYISNKAAVNFYDVSELPNGKKDFDTYAREFDVILVDSWNKLYKIIKMNLDFDIRNKFNGKIFSIIYQRTQDGKMRGGAEAQFDGDVVLKIQKFPDFKKNFVYYDKNRYMIDDYKWNIYNQRLIQPENN